MACRGRCGRRWLWRGFLVNELAHLIHLLIELVLRALDALLAQVNSFGKQVAACLDGLAVGAFFQVDTSALQKAAQVLEELVFFEWCHK